MSDSEVSARRVMVFILENTAKNRRQSLVDGLLGKSDDSRAAWLYAKPASFWNKAAKPRSKSATANCKSHTIVQARQTESLPRDRNHVLLIKGDSLKLLPGSLVSSVNRGIAISAVTFSSHFSSGVTERRYMESVDSRTDSPVTGRD